MCQISLFAIKIIFFDLFREFPCCWPAEKNVLRGRLHLSALGANLNDRVSAGGLRDASLYWLDCE